MSMASSLAHAQRRNHFHACAFVTDPGEERAVIGASAPSTDLFEVTTWNEAHLKGGSFDENPFYTAREELLRELRQRRATS